MCYADQPIDLSRREFGVSGGLVYRYQSIEVPSGHVGGPSTEFRCLAGNPVGYVDPRLPDRAWVNGQVRRLNGFGGLS